MKFILCVIFFVIILSGCAAPPTTAELRSKPPSKSSVVAGDYYDIGSCVAEGMQCAANESTFFNEVGPADLIYEVIHRSNQKKY